MINRSLIFTSFFPLVDNKTAVMSLFIGEMVTDHPV